MSDILVLDMKMPLTCSQCPMCYDYMMCKPLHVYFSENESFDCCDDRLGGCPLVEVPKRKAGFSPYDVCLALVDAGQRDKRFKLGETIKYSPSEVYDILTRKGETE